MDRATTIEEFNALMQSDQDNTLVAALRTLCSVDEPQNVRDIRSKANPRPQGSWGGWDW